LGATHQSNS